ncbi:type II secretion system minor pseudopilin GspK [Methylomonas sp. HYX-M1]|uniref:type II secretion system minor pseudopilin GspK n=1 Tax=Methylomonas sp. HYX-M1 TaxID=3139307 RepID=UPI00345C5E87
MPVLVRQRGVALLTVLLVLALATVSVLSMSGERQLDIRRTDNQLRNDQAWVYAHALEDWAVRILQAGDAAGRNVQLQEQGNVELKGRLLAQQHTFNLNNLLVEGELQTQELQRLRRLLRYLELDPAIADAIVDWLDADSEIRYPAGAEDEVYSRLHPPYRAANRNFADLSELRLVKGIGPAEYAKLRPYLSAIDAYLPLNVNTAPPLLLRCLADDISEDLAEAIFRAAGKPFKDVAAFLQDEAVLGSGIGNNGITVGNRHYLLQGLVSFGGVTLRFESRLQTGGEGQVWFNRRARVANFDG